MNNLEKSMYKLKANKETIYGITATLTPCTPVVGGSLNGRLYSNGMFCTVNVHTRKGKVVKVEVGDHVVSHPNLCATPEGEPFHPNDWEKSLVDIAEEAAKKKHRML